MPWALTKRRRRRRRRRRSFKIPHSETETGELRGRTLLDLKQWWLIKRV
jgi:hypothetical protein